MGSRTACSAVYPEPFVNLLLDQVPQTAPDGGRIDRGTAHFDLNSDSAHIRQVVHLRLGELKDQAVRRGMLSLWIKLVEPWMGTSTASSAHLNEERSVAKSGNLPTPVGNPVVLGPSTPGKTRSGSTTISSVSWFSVASGNRPAGRGITSIFIAEAV